MAESSQKWEVVKNAKTKKQPGKQERQMPRIEPPDPLKIKPTQFHEAFGPKVTTSSQPKPNNQPQKKQPAKKKSVQAKEPPKKQQSLEDALKEVDVPELSNILVKSQALFPNNPEVWLLDVCAALQSQLDNVIPVDPTFPGLSNEYPLNAVSSELRTLLSTSIADGSLITLEKVYTQCVQHIISASLKDSTAFGSLIFIQAISREKPLAALQTIDKLRERSDKYKNQRNVCLSILWCSAQIGRGSKNLGTAIKVWLEVMFPLINLKAMAPYVTDFLHKCLKQIWENNSIADDVLSAEKFVSLVSLYCEPPNCISSLKLTARINDDYSKLKVAVLEGNNQRAQMYFPKLLAKVNPQGDSKLNAELVSLLVMCLRQEQACVTQWRKILGKHLPQSSMLLNALIEQQEWQVLQAATPSLKTALQHLNRPDDGRVIQINRLLLALEQRREQVSKGRRWPRYVFMFFLLLVVVLSVDIARSGSLKASFTGQQLKKAGLLIHVQRAQKQAQQQMKIASQWMKKNIPIYWNKAILAATPFAQQVKDGCIAAGLWLYEVSTPVRLVAYDYAVIALDYVQTNGPVWLAFCKLQGQWLWNLLLDWYNVAVSWLLANVFIGNLSPENLYSLTSQLLLSCREQLVLFYNWCSTLGH